MTTLLNMYAKLFSRITQSSLMEENINTRYVFMMMLAIADKEGDVIGTDVATARTINIPLADFKEAIADLMAPDEDSNSPDHEGRRLIESPNGRGYQIVNYKSYRNIKSDEEKKAYMREYMRQRRARKRAEQGDVGEGNPCKESLSDVTQAEAESEAEAEIHINEGQPPCTLDQALSYAKTIGIYPDAAEVWFNTRDRDGWTVHRNNGNQTPITKNNWQKDLAQAKTWSCNKPPTKEPDAPEGTRRDGKIMVNGIWRKMT